MLRHAVFNSQCLNIISDARILICTMKSKEHPEYTTAPEYTILDAEYTIRGQNTRSWPTECTMTLLNTRSFFQNTRLYSRIHDFVHSVFRKNTRRFHFLSFPKDSSERNSNLVYSGFQNTRFSEALGGGFWLLSAGGVWLLSAGGRWRRLLSAGGVGQAQKLISIGFQKHCKN